MRGKVRILTVFGGALCLPALFGGRYYTANAQFSGQQQIDRGTILFANEKLGDPNFAESVILIIDFDADKGTEGLVVNRQTEVSLAQVFPNAKHATKDPVYLGGPVEVRSVQALLRLADKSEHATRVIGDVYVTGTRDLIDKSIDSRTDPSKFRLYLGYAGWGPGQLQGEIRLGAWSVINGTSKIVFDPNPDSLWSRLNREAKMRLALVQPQRLLGNLLLAKAGAR